MRVDCDQDAILLKVRIAGDGVACHQGYRSCFYRTVPLGDGTDAGDLAASTGRCRGRPRRRAAIKVFRRNLLRSMRSFIIRLEAVRYDPAGVGAGGSEVDVRE